MLLGIAGVVGAGGGEDAPLDFRNIAGGEVRVTRKLVKQSVATSRRKWKGRCKGQRSGQRGSRYVHSGSGNILWVTMYPNTALFNPPPPFFFPWQGSDLISLGR